MPEGPRPRVAVIGGFYDSDTDPKLGDEAREYAKLLGRALAEGGFGLVVYFSNDKSLEPHVVSGFVAALPPAGSASCIDVRYSEAQLGQVRFMEQDTQPELFHEDPFPGRNWEAPFYRSLAARDSLHAALLMAGGDPRSMLAKSPWAADCRYWPSTSTLARHGHSARNWPPGSTDTRPLRV
jgi:hypothetical protein